MKLKKSVFVLCLVVIFVSEGDAFYRQILPNRRYPNTSGPSNASTHLLQAKSGSENDLSRDSLLKIAKDTSAQIERREAAVSALSRYSDAETSRVLASLLLPQTSLSLRLAIASHLRQSKCDESCVQSILLYLERNWRGEPNIEDGSKDAEVNLEIKRLQDRLRNQLYDDLLRERRQLGEALVSYFGLGSPVPSLFGLHVVSDLKLTDTCIELELSSRSVSNSQLERQVDSLMHELDCKQTLPPLYAPK